MLAVGGKANSLGRADEVVKSVLADKSRLDELYHCLFEDDAWIRMRAIDSLEKVCREHPEWLKPYVGRLLSDVAAIDQASVQWHLAQLFAQIDLSQDERLRAIEIMKRNIADESADWIVASNTMKTLTQYAMDGYLSVSELVPLLKVQQKHRSSAVVKVAGKCLDALAR